MIDFESLLGERLPGWDRADHRQKQGIRNLATRAGYRVTYTGFVERL